MALFQSFWSKPAEANRWKRENQVEGNIWIAALSAVYAKRNNIPLIMHTDDFGKQLLQHLPYSEIKLTLNKIPKDTPIGQWAVGKFYALREQDLGDIHIDYDVFIKSKQLYDYMMSTKCDCLVQSFEHAGSYYDIIKPYLKDLDLNVELNLPYAYNCGVVGFKNQELKQKYMDDYFQFYEIVKQHPEINKHINTNDWTLELIIEQQNLYKLCTAYKPECLFHSQHDPKIKYYEHLIGRGKYDKIDEVKEILKRLDPEIYNKTEEIVNEYVKNKKN